eukprot:XP_001690053.1 predicted protein [Chlamydomonas reinhardtii]
MAAEGSLASVWRASAGPSRSSSVSLDHVCGPPHRHEGSVRFVPSGEHNSAAFFTPLASIQHLDDMLDDFYADGPRASAHVTPRISRAAAAAEPGSQHSGSSSSLRLHVGQSAAAMACGASQLPSGGSRGLAPTRRSRAGDSQTLPSDAGTHLHRHRDSVDVLRAFLDDGPTVSSVATSHLASASAVEFPVVDGLARSAQPGAAGPRGRCSVESSALPPQPQQPRPPDCVAKVVDCHLPIGEETGEGTTGEGEREGEGADEERRTSRTSASSAASAGSQLSASSMGLPTSGSVCGAGSTPRGGNSHKGMASTSGTPPAASGAASVPPPGAPGPSITRLVASIAGLGGSLSVGSTGHAAGVSSQPGSAAGPLHGGVLSSLRKAASDVVSQLRALRPGKTGTAAATPTATPTAAAAAVHARAPSANAVWASMPPQYDCTSPSLGNSSKDALHLPWVAPRPQDVSGNVSVGTTGMGAGPRGEFLDEVGLEAHGSDLMPDMWDLAHLVDELEDGWGPRGGVPAAGGLPPSVPVARALPVVSVGPQRTHRTHASTAPVELTADIEANGDGISRDGVPRLQAAFTGAKAAAAGGSGRACSSVGIPQGATSRFASGLTVTSVPGLLSHEGAASPRVAQYPVSLPAMTATVAATAAALGLRGNDAEQIYVLGELVQTARASESVRRSPHVSGVACGVLYTATNGLGSANKVPGFPTATYMTAAFGSTFRAGSTLGSGSVLAGEPGDEDEDSSAAAAARPFSLHVLVSCGCGAPYGCYCATREAVGGAAASSHTCTPPDSALSLTRTLAAPDARRAAAATQYAAEEQEQRVTVNAMLSGVQLACVPLQEGGGCQARVKSNLKRLTELTGDGEDATSAAARRRDLQLLRQPCTPGAPPPWRLSPAVWAACRSEWRGSMQPLLADICYLLLCVPNCFAHGLVEWDRAMYCETLARLLGQLERYKLWATISVLLEYCRRQGVALLYQGEAVGAGSLTAERVRALLEGALHDEISIKAVDRGAQEAGGGGGICGMAGGAGAGGFGFQVGAQVWTAAAGLSAPCSGDDDGSYGGNAPVPPKPGPAPVRTLRSQASIGRVLTRVLTALGAGEDDAAHTPMGTPRTPLAAGAAARPFADVGPASAEATGGGPAAAPGEGATAAKTRGQRLGHVIEGAAVVLAFAGVMLQSLQ